MSTVYWALKHFTINVKQLAVSLDAATVTLNLRSIYEVNFRKLIW